MVKYTEHTNIYISFAPQRGVTTLYLGKLDFDMISFEDKMF
jgi:hypothetical protein